MHQQYREKAMKTIKALKAKVDSQAAEIKAARAILESKALGEAEELGASSAAGSAEEAVAAAVAPLNAEKVRLAQRVEDLTTQVMVLSEVADVTDMEEELALAQTELGMSREKCARYKARGKALKEELTALKQSASAGGGGGSDAADERLARELEQCKQKLQRAGAESVAEIEPLKLALRERSAAAETCADTARAAVAAERRAAAVADELRRRVADLEAAGAGGSDHTEVEALRRQNDELRNEQHELRSQIDALDSEVLAKEDAATLLEHSLAMSKMTADELQAQLGDLAATAAAFRCGWCFICGGGVRRAR